MHNASSTHIIFIALALTNLASHLHSMNSGEIDPEEIRRVQARERHLVVKSLFNKAEQYHAEIAKHLKDIEKDQSPVVNIEEIEKTVILKSLEIPANELSALEKEYKSLQQACYELREEIKRLQERKDVLEKVKEELAPDPAVALCGIQ